MWHGYRGHDCKRAGCQPHVCRPMTAKTIRNVHSILSGTFATAKRWEWIAWNPAESAKPPAVTRRPLPATTPEDVAKVIAEGRKAHPVLALKRSLAAITAHAEVSGAALRDPDVDLANGFLDIALIQRGRWLAVRKDTKNTGSVLGIDRVTCARKEHDMIAPRWPPSALSYPTTTRVLESTDTTRGRGIGWATHKASDLADVAVLSRA